MAQFVKMYPAPPLNPERTQVLRRFLDKSSKLLPLSPFPRVQRCAVMAEVEVTPLGRKLFGLEEWSSDALGVMDKNGDEQVCRQWMRACGIVYQVMCLPRAGVRAVRSRSIKICLGPC